MAILCLLISTGLCAETVPPKPKEILSTVNDLWNNQKFTELEVFILDLDKSFPNYVPTILIKSFYLGVYKGKVLEAKRLLVSIRDDAAKYENKYKNNFVGFLAFNITMIEADIEINQAQNPDLTALEALASPIFIYNQWKGKKIPFVEILDISPEISINPLAPSPQHKETMR